MFLRAKIRKKDGKVHRYFSVVENQRVRGGRVVQRHVLYLGEINSSQELAWCRSIEVLDEGSDAPRSLALFPEDCEGLLSDESVVRLRMSHMRLVRARHWGGCWLALQLWRELELDEFWAERLLPSRKGTRWSEVLLILVVYRLLSPGSEWRLHREWYGRSALADLLGLDRVAGNILQPGHPERTAEPSGQPSRHADAVRMHVRAYHALHRLPGHRLAEYGFPRRGNLRGLHARVHERPTVALLQGPQVNVVEGHWQRHSQPMITRGDLEELSGFRQGRQRILEASGEGY